MRIDESLSESAVAAELGRRLAAVRLSMNLSQQDVAKRSRIGKRTLQRLELGLSATQLAGFLRVCRTLKLLDRIDQMITEPPPSPFEELKRGEKIRKRAAPRKHNRPTRPWKWGTSS